MSLQDRISALRERHASLETQIFDESNRPHPDDWRIAELKRQKLRIKDEIERMTHRVEA
ncbi:YdcH family protein [Ferruginivarius sediminum]|uniref:DUF465 domain-containing protein n=1 Tax=Ferruginivarius sediminum TaxID=2661937 RepID=A0A369T8Z2_9PROT|nr:DUF465 domain-containing protein [Ferruginivarius sediminum]RDD61773.1 DUF465 domain-containing protein [Ferruginivarius sediminum]